MLTRIKQDCVITMPVWRKVCTRPCKLQTKLLGTILTLEANYKWLLIALQFRESLASEHLHAICVYREHSYNLQLNVYSKQYILLLMMFKLLRSNQIFTRSEVVWAILCGKMIKDSINDVTEFYSLLFL